MKNYDEKELLYDFVHTKSEDVDKIFELYDKIQHRKQLQSMLDEVDIYNDKTN